MAERQKMMATMRAMDQKLDELVALMKSATRAAKVDAIANVLARLVEQRATMRSGMMDMQGGIMGMMLRDPGVAETRAAADWASICGIQALMPGAKTG